MIIPVYEIKAILESIPIGQIARFLKDFCVSSGNLELFHTIDTSSLDDMLALIFDLIPIMIIMAFLQGIMSSLKGFSI